MRFITFERNGERRPGLAREEGIVDLTDAGFTDLLSVLRGGAAALEVVTAFRGEPSAEPVTLCAPIPNPGKILCVGLNYRDHAREAKLDLPICPTLFPKYSNTILGPGGNIVLPKNSAKPDYEAEFAFVIGKRGRHIPAASWRDHVFGYMNFNDVSARDVQLAATQWTMGKNFDTFAPMGPWLVTADEIEDPHNLEISLTLNGETLQHSNTGELIFKIPELVEFISSVMTLEPGDIVSTGTPAGVGFGHRPPKWLTPGAEVVVKIQGLGELRNFCVAESG